MKRTTKIALAGVAGAGLFALGRLADARRLAGIARAVEALGERDDDPTSFPDGDDFVVATDDGAEITGTDCGGTGPTVVLIHGYIGARSHWGTVARRLVARGHRVIGYDQRGHGASTAGGDGFTMERLANDLRAVLDGRQLDDVVLAGHSMGGMAIQAYLGHHGEHAAGRVRAAFLVATAARPSSRTRRLAGAAPLLMGSQVIDRALADDERGPLLVRDSAGPTCTRAELVALRDSVVSTAPMSRRLAVAMLATYDLRESNRRIAVPTVVIGGTHDQLTPVALSHELAELIPGAEVVIHDGEGHMLPWTKADDLAEAIAAAVEADRPVVAPVSAAG